MIHVVLALVMFLAFPVAISAEDILITSDLSWKVSKTAPAGWLEAGFNDVSWPYSKAPSQGTCDYRPDPAYFTQPMWAPVAHARETAYFRREFLITKPVQSAVLKAGFDDDGEVYVNGTRVLVDRSGKTEKVAMEADVTALLREGQNVLALKGIDSFGGCQWAQASLHIIMDEGNHLGVPLVKQSDPAWSQREYDHASVTPYDCGTTIGQCGCAVASLAMVLQYHGVAHSASGAPTNPQTLNEYFSQGAQCSVAGCISQGYVFGNVRWNAINKYSAEAHAAYGTSKVQFVSADAYDRDVVIQDVAHAKPVILRAPSASHWFVATGTLADTLFINDPFFNRIRLDDAAYENRAGAMRRYEKVNSDFSLIEAYIPWPGQLMITDMYGRRAGYDATTGEVMNEIPRAQYTFESSFSPDSRPEKGIMWLFIPKPEEGIYTISAMDDAEFGLYVSDRSGGEKFSLASESAHIYYDPGDIQRAVADVKPACYQD